MTEAKKRDKAVVLATKGDNEAIIARVNNDSIDIGHVRILGDGESPGPGADLVHLTGDTKGNLEIEEIHRGRRTTSGGRVSSRPAT